MAQAKGAAREREVFGLPADPELQGPDGDHSSPAGQKAITRAFVEGLTM
jgi:acyl-CoA thioesterase I